MKDNSKNRRFIVIFSTLSLLLIFSVVGFYYHDEEINFFMVSMIKNRTTDNEIDTSQVNFRVLSNVGAREYLNAEIVVPCENDGQYYELTRKMNRIKSDILLIVNQDDMEKWIKERNFAAIKYQYLKIINLHAKIPVKNIYFDSLHYQ